MRQEKTKQFGIWLNYLAFLESLQVSFDQCRLVFTILSWKKVLQNILWFFEETGFGISNSLEILKRRWQIFTNDNKANLAKNSIFLVVARGILLLFRDICCWNVPHIQIQGIDVRSKSHYSSCWARSWGGQFIMLVLVRLEFVSSFPEFREHAKLICSTISIIIRTHLMSNLFDLHASIRITIHSIQNLNWSQVWWIL